MKFINYDKFMIKLIMISFNLDMNGSAEDNIIHYSAQVKFKEKYYLFGSFD